jgi:hypothetical protein
VQGRHWEALKSGMMRREVELGAMDILHVLVSCVGRRGWAGRNLDAP